MKIHEIILPDNTDCEMEAAGVGQIVKGVNTTADVKPGETERQAKKFFGGTGKPKLLTKRVKETSISSLVFQWNPAIEITGLVINGNKKL